MVLTAASCFCLRNLVQVAVRTHSSSPGLVGRAVPVTTSSIWTIPIYSGSGLAGRSLGLQEVHGILQRGLQQVHEGPELPGRVVPNSSSFQLDFCFEDSGCLGFRASGNLASFLVQSLCGRSWGLRNSGLIILTLGRPPRLARDQHCDRTHRLAAVT